MNTHESFSYWTHFVILDQTSMGFANIAVQRSGVFLFKNYWVFSNLTVRATSKLKEISYSN